MPLSFLQNVHLLLKFFRIAVCLFHPLVQFGRVCRSLPGAEYVLYKPNDGLRNWGHCRLRPPFRKWGIPCGQGSVSLG